LNFLACSNDAGVAPLDFFCFEHRLLAFKEHAVGFLVGEIVHDVCVVVGKERRVHLYIIRLVVEFYRFLLILLLS